MRIIKFAVSSILIFIVLMILGEIQYFDAVYSLDNKLPKAEFHQRIINYNGSIADSAEEIYQRMNCDIFFIKYDYPSLTETTATIICRKKIMNDLKKEFSLSREKYKSLFGGTLTVLFEEIPDEKEIVGCDFIYFYGEQANIANTYQKMKKELGGGDFYECSYDNRYSIFTGIVSAAVIAIISFSSLCECEFKKKVYAVKLIFGTKSTELFFKELIKNLFEYLLIIVLECLIIFKYNNLLNNLKQIIIFYFVLSTCTSIAYVSIFKVNVIKILKNKKDFSGIISLGYIFKFITVVLTVFSGAAFYRVVPEISEAITAKSFFSEINDGAFCDFQTSFDLDNLNSSRQYYRYANESIYRTYYNTMTPIILSQINAYNEYTDDIEIVYANSNAREYIQNIFGEQNADDDSDLIIFLPKRLAGTDIEKTVLSAYENIEGDYKYTYSIVYAKKNYKLLTIDSNISKYYKYLKDPVVIFNTVPANEMNTSIDDSNKFSLYRNIIYLNADKYINTIQSEYDLSMVIKTQCSIYFERSSRQNKLIFIFFSLSFLLFLFFAMFMSASITTTVFKINAKEYTIKKILGYRRSETYGSFILTVILSDAAAVLLCLLAGSKIIYTLAVTGMFLITIDVIFELLKIFTLEKTNISKIIKDGLYD